MMTMMMTLKAAVVEAVMSSSQITLLCVDDVSMPRTRGRYVRCSTCRGRTTVFQTTVLTSSNLSTKYVEVGLESLSLPLCTAGLH